MGEPKGKEFAELPPRLVPRVRIEEPTSRTLIEETEKGATSRIRLPKTRQRVIPTTLGKQIREATETIPRNEFLLRNGIQSIYTQLLRTIDERQKSSELTRAMKALNTYEKQLGEKYLLYFLVNDYLDVQDILKKQKAQRTNAPLADVLAQIAFNKFFNMPPHERERLIQTASNNVPLESRNLVLQSTHRRKAQGAFVPQNQPVLGYEDGLYNGSFDLGELRRFQKELKEDLERFRQLEITVLKRTDSPTFEQLRNTILRDGATLERVLDIFNFLLNPQNYYGACYNDITFNYNLLCRRVVNQALSELTQYFEEIKGTLNYFQFYIYNFGFYYLKYLKQAVEVRESLRRLNRYAKELVISKKLERENIPYTQEALNKAFKDVVRARLAQVVNVMMNVDMDFYKLARDQYREVIGKVSKEERVKAERKRYSNPVGLKEYLELVRPFGFILDCSPNWTCKIDYTNDPTISMMSETIGYLKGSPAGTDFRSAQDELSKLESLPAEQKEKPETQEKIRLAKINLNSEDGNIYLQSLLMVARAQYFFLESVIKLNIVFPSQE